MLEKQHEINQKAFDKIQKLSDELLRERDAIHKELKRTESMCFAQNKCCTNIDWEISWLLGAHSFIHGDSIRASSQLFERLIKFYSDNLRDLSHF